MNNRLAMSTLVLMGWSAGLVLAAPPQSGPLPDWPCRGVDADPLTAATLLPHPLAMPAHDGNAWKADPRVRAVVDFAAAPENVPDLGVARIAALAREAGSGNTQALPLVLDGVIARTNQLRGFIEDGVTDKVAQSHLLADEVAGGDRAIASLRADDPPERRTAIEQAQRRNRAALGDRAEDAELLCHRLDYTAHKARLLGAAIAEQIESAKQ